MPVHSHPPCPGCSEPLVHKPAGRCPRCGADVAAFVAAERRCEARIEKVVAIVSTILVVTVLVLGGGLGLVEGIAMYAAAGAFVWYLAKGTFFARRRGGAVPGAAQAADPSREAPEEP